MSERIETLDNTQKNLLVWLLRLDCGYYQDIIDGIF